MTSKEGRVFPLKLFAMLFVLFAMLLLAPLVASAEGSKDLVANGGSRPFLEWNNTSTMGLKRTQLIYVYANEGETIYFGSSVASGYAAVKNASVGVVMPTADGKSYADINADFKKDPASFSGKAANQFGTMNPTFAGDYARNKVYFFKGDGTTGYIDTLAKEKAGPNLTGNGGYTPFSITVPEGCGGVWTFMFYSKSYTSGNPVPTVTSSGSFVSNQKDTMVGAWDVTVEKKDHSLANGRVACERLFLNMGGNGNGIQLNSVVYALTRLGFAYKIDFNGGDPYGFVFYVNNRGLLRQNSDNTYQSLMHSAISDKNEMNSFVNKAGEKLNFLANAIPTQAGVDETYLLFFNSPDADYIKVATERGKILTQSDVTNHNINSLEFVGMNPKGESGALINNVAPATEGCGGRFIITMEEGSIATSFKITLDMTGNKTLCDTYGYAPDMQNIITLSNAVINGTGQVEWDGKDAFGNVVPARVSPYGTDDLTVSVIATAGEVHLPLLDVENNPNGVRVEMLNDLDNTDKTTVYYNNVNDATGAYGWYSGAYKIGDSKDGSTGVDTSDGGAMQYTGNAGNQCALDMWSYFVVQTREDISLAIKIVKQVALEVDKTWQTTSPSGEVDGNPPQTVKLHLQWRLRGDAEWKDYDGAVAAYKSDVLMQTGESYRFEGMELFPYLDEDVTSLDESRNYEYRVREVTESLSRYVLTADSAADASQPMSFAVNRRDAETLGVVTYLQSLTNTYKGPDTQLNVTKTWVTTSENGETDSDAPTTITLRLQQRLVGTAGWVDYAGLVTEYHAPVTFDTTQNNGVYSFMGLELADENGTAYEYRAQETPLDKYELTDSQPANRTEAMSHTTVTIVGTSVKLYTQDLTNTYVAEVIGSGSWTPPGAASNLKIAYKYLYGYNDGAAGIYGANKRYSEQSGGYYYLNTEEAAALIYRVRLQEGAASAPTVGASFDDVPTNGWALHALTFLKNLFGNKVEARKAVSADTLQQMIQAHYGEGQALDLSGTNVTRIDFLRAFNHIMGRTSVTEIRANDGTLLCSYAGGFYTVTADASRYYFASEMPTEGEEIYQVLLACHSYRIYNNGTVAVIAPDLEQSRYALDQGEAEADEEIPTPVTMAVNFFASLFEQKPATAAESTPAAESIATAESSVPVEEAAAADISTEQAG